LHTDADVNLVSAIFGLVLLLFGRRLFWFFVAAAGFSAGMFIARDQLHLESQMLVLAIALLAGLIGALLSIFLQKLAIAVAGFAAAGYLCATLLTRLKWDSFAWIGFILGGIIGAVLLLTVFEWALIILSSLIGAAFVADGFGTNENALILFAIAFILGVIVQRVQMRPAPKPQRAQRTS
jgi:hypothetical protein